MCYLCIMNYRRVQINAVCSNCGSEFLKDQSEVIRNARKGRLNYCSRSCAIKAGNSRRLVNPKSWEHLSKYKREPDHFKEFLRRVRKRFKESDKKNFTITLQDLKDQWESQSGICPYSGITLSLPSCNRSNLDKASLDRIDSSKGYHRDNIQFVSSNINYMKSDLSHEETLKLCQLIAKNYKSGDL